MYDRILFPTDGSETASTVLDDAITVASTHGATLHVVHVVDRTSDGVARVSDELVDDRERAGERIVEAAATRATDRGVSVETDVLGGVPAETILEHAAEADVDLVLMATHGRKGVERFLLGSVTERVVNASPVPVLTVTPDENEVFTYPPRTVLVPTDGSEGANRALREAVDLAAATGAVLHLLHVVETASLGIDVRSSAVMDELDDRATEILEDAAETARAASLDVTTTVAHGRPIREIHSYVGENDVDVVALGTQGRTDFSRYVLGGVSAKLLRTSPVPVLLVRDPDDDAVGADGG